MKERDNLELVLERIRDLKHFAVNELGITPNPSFRKVKEGAGFFVIYVSRSDAIEPPKGVVNGEVYKTKKEANQIQRELRASGHETRLESLEAVGEHACPITKSLIKAKNTRMAYIILHENMHIHCELNNIKLKLSVEEAVANYFAYQGSLLYFKDNPQMRATIEKDFHKWNQHYAFFKKYLQKLNDAYKISKESGREVLEQAKKEIPTLPTGVISRYTRTHLNTRVNNAYFLSMAEYATNAVQVYEALEGLHPLEYTQDKRVLLKAVKGIR